MPGSGEPAVVRCGNHRHAILSQILLGASGSRKRFLFICSYLFRSSGWPGLLPSPSHPTPAALASGPHPFQAASVRNCSLSPPVTADPSSGRSWREGGCRSFCPSVCCRHRCCQTVPGWDSPRLLWHFGQGTFAGLRSPYVMLGRGK